MSKISAIDTLFHPFTSGQIPWPDENQKTAFLNAHPHPALSNFANLTCQQFFKPTCEALKNNGYKVAQHIENQLDTILIALPKNHIESEHLIALALQHLTPGGLLIAAADNKAGGTRIAKIFKDFGLSGIISESKNKARVVWTTKNTTNETKITQAIQNGMPQTKNSFHTIPGIYGWDKIDKGSEILTRHIPIDLKGHGADFGCGYGFLARHALDNCEKIKSLACVDADHRALECCKLNLEKAQNSDFGSQSSEIVPSDREAAEGRKTSETDRTSDIKYIWADLTQTPPPLKNLDFIIMNPPFHEGKTTDPAIGKAFIETAHSSLKKHGALYMVANVQLPYEDTLSHTFFKIKKLHEGSGFKVYKAVK